MQINFQLVRWKNLLSTGNVFLSVKLNTAEMTLIIGKNGQGKSQLLDAICFVLYNKPYRDINKPQLVNSINKKECLVEIAFTIGSHSYIVRRGIKPALFEIYRDKVLIPEDSAVGDYQAQLEKILGMNYKTFCQVNILGKASYIPFMQLKPMQRREVVEDILDSQIYSVMLQLEKAELKALGDKFREVNSQIQVIQAEIAGWERLIARQQDDKEERYTNVQKIINGLLAQAEPLQQEIFKLTVNQTEAVTILARIAKDPSKIIEAKSDLQMKIIQNEMLVEQLDRKLKNLHVSECPTCFQKIDPSHLEEINQEVTAEKYPLEQKLVADRAKEAMVKDLLSQWTNQREIVDKVTAELNQAKQRLAYVDKQLEERLKERDNINLDQVDTVDQKALETKQGELKKSKIYYDNVSEEIDLSKKTISYLGDDGIKAKLVNKYISKINQQINHYLEKLDLFVQFELDEQFNETIRSRYRDTFTYESFSEGEKLRINLALLFTWRYIAKLRNSVSTNLLIMDEVLDSSMDTEGITSFLGTFDDIQNLIMISHSATIIEGFDNVIVAEKIGNFTEYRPYNG